VTAVAVVGVWPVWDSWPLTCAGAVLTSLAWVTTAALLAPEPGQLRNAILFGLVGLGWAAEWLDNWNVGPFPLLAYLAGPPYLVCGAIVLLRYPAGRLRRSERRFLVTMAVWLVTARLGTAVTSQPARFEYGSWVWWPTLQADDRLYRVASTIYWVGAAIFAVGVLLLLRWRIRREAHVDRWVLIPLQVTLAAVVVILAVRVPWRLFAPNTTTPVHLVAAVTVGLLLVPMGFLVSAVRRRSARIAVADLVLRIGGLVTAEQLRDALRDALRDPRLEVLYYALDIGGFMDSGGVMADPSRPGPGRVVRQVLGEDGTPLAAVVVDAALVSYPDLLDAALAVSRLALNNGRLTVMVRAVRRELVDARQAERRRIERDLHDGVQQRLVALAMRLAAAEVAGGPGSPLLAQTRSELHAALRDLRDLAHGVHPAVLTDGGLRHAIADLAERMPLPVRVDVSDERWTPAVETAAYFVVAEALTNTMKHAGASTAGVRIRAAGGGHLRIEVFDDGPGGADLRTGTGLAGLRDRVLSLGGELTLDNSRGARLIADLPPG
jgi:signal transduction histidine kinase